MTDVAAPTSPERPTAAETGGRRGPARWIAAQEPRELAFWGALIAAAVPRPGRRRRSRAS